MADLNDTLAFVSVAETGSFTAAARELRLPKTTLSRRIRNLEAHLGAQLLYRTTRRLRLTEAGAVYFEACRPIAHRLADAEALVGQLQGQPCGLLRLTASYSVMLNLVGPLLAEFRSLHPEVTIDLVVSHETLDLMEARIDIALRLGPLTDSSLMARRLARLPNRVYASPHYLAAHGEPTHPSELRRHAALVTRVARQGGHYAWPMSQDGVAGDFPISPIVEADDPELLKAPLFAGVGLMMATDMIMSRHVAEGLVKPILPGWLGRCPDLHAVFPGGRIQPPKLRAFIEFLTARLDCELASHALPEPPALGGEPKGVA